MNGMRGSAEFQGALLSADTDPVAATQDVCGFADAVITHKSRTVRFPVLHGRGFL
jgi:hypothetical protein